MKVNIDKILSEIERLETSVASIEQRKVSFVESHRSEINSVVQQRLNALIPEFKIKVAEELFADKFKEIAKEIEAFSDTLEMLKSFICEEIGDTDDCVSSRSNSDICTDGLTSSNIVNSTSESDSDNSEV